MYLKTESYSYYCMLIGWEKYEQTSCDAQESMS